MKRRIFILSAIVLGQMFYTGGARAENRVHFELKRYADTDFFTSSEYYIDVYATTTDHEWDVSSFNMAIEYNKEALKDPVLEVVNDDVLDDAYLVTVTDNTFPDPAWFRLNVLKFNAPYTKIPAGERVLLVTIRMSLKGPELRDHIDQGREGDGVWIKTDNNTVMYHGAQLQLFYDTDDSDGWGASNSTQVIWSCHNTYWFFDDCRTFVDDVTENPLEDGAAYWMPVPGPNGDRTVVLYQYDFDNDKTPTDSDRIYNFDKSQLEIIGDDCRCLWRAQTENHFDWEVTSTGGRFHFSTDASDFGRGDEARVLVAATHLATKDNPPDEAYVRLYDTTWCGEGLEGQSSRIVFNNTEDYFDENPDARWTTAAPRENGSYDCGGFYCIDFRSVFHHELGHYLGLGHSHHPDEIMHGWGLPANTVETKMSQCDADRVRRLYNPDIVGIPPENYGAKRPKDISTAIECEAVSGVKVIDHESTVNVKVSTVSLEVFPVPIRVGNEFLVQYSLPYSSNVHLTLCDLYGRELATLVQGQQPSGTHQLAIETAALSAGVLFVHLETPEGVVTASTLVVR